MSWPAGAGGERKLRLEVDVDGDGRTDVLEAQSSSGSGFASTDVQLTLGGKIDLDGEVWLFYAGGVHAYKEPVEMARTGDRVLLGTAHGVILTNPKRSRHAWIYVSEGCDKLRSPCIAGALIQGDTATIRTLKRSPDLESKPSQVRVNLKTGAISK